MLEHMRFALNAPAVPRTRGTKMAEPILLSVRETARLLGVSVSSVWRRTKDGTLPEPIRIGGLTRYRREEVLAALDRAGHRRR